MEKIKTTKTKSHKETKRKTPLEKEKWYFPGLYNTC